MVLGAAYVTLQDQRFTTVKCQTYNARDGNWCETLVIQVYTDLAQAHAHKKRLSAQNWWPSTFTFNCLLSMIAAVDHRQVPTTKAGGSRTQALKQVEKLANVMKSLPTQSSLQQVKQAKRPERRHATEYKVHPPGFNCSKPNVERRGIPNPHTTRFCFFFRILISLATFCTPRELTDSIGFPEVMGIISLIVL